MGSRVAGLRPEGEAEGAGVLRGGWPGALECGGESQRQASSPVPSVWQPLWPPLPALSSEGSSWKPAGASSSVALLCVSVVAPREADSPALPLTGCVTLGRLLSLSVSWVPHV